MTARLSEADRAAIMSQYVSGVPLKEISKQHGVSPEHCARVARRQGAPARVPAPPERKRNSRFVDSLRSAISQTGMNVRTVSDKALGTRAAYQWMKDGTSPRIDNFEAVLNVLGLTLKIVPLEEKA